MDNNLLKQYLSKLSNASSNDEIEQVLNEIVPKLKEFGITPAQIMIYFKMHGNEAIPKSQDHSSSISNANKAQIVLQKLLSKLSK